MVILLQGFLGAWIRNSLGPRHSVNGFLNDLALYRFCFGTSIKNLWMTHRIRSLRGRVGEILLSIQPTAWKWDVGSQDSIGPLLHSIQGHLRAQQKFSLGNTLNSSRTPNYFGIGGFGFITMKEVHSFTARRNWLWSSGHSLGSQKYTSGVKE